jgi:hypothetical protein
LQQPRCTPALGSLARLLRFIGLSLVNAGQIFEETSRCAAVVLGIVHAGKQASCMPHIDAQRKTLTLSGGLAPQRL